MLTAVKELISGHQAAAGGVGGATAMAVAIPLLERFTEELKEKYYDFGKVESAEIEQLRNLYRDHCAYNERDGALTTLFPGMDLDGENNRGIPIYFQMDPNRPKQPMFYKNRFKTIIETSTWDKHVSKASLLSELSFGIKDMIAEICNYQIVRNEGLFKLTFFPIVIGIGGKGYFYDPTNLFFEEFKRWLVELSKAPLDEKTLRVVEGRMDYLRKVDVTQVFKQSYREITRRETVISLLKHMVNTIRPVIMSVIAARGSREHYESLTKNVNGLIRESAKFCFYVFRDTQDTPKAFKLGDMSDALANYTKILAGTRSGMLLNKLFNCPLYQLPNAKSDSEKNTEPKLEFTGEIDALLYDNPNNKTDWGVLVDFRTASTMKLFYHMHSIMEKLFLFKKIAHDLYGLSNEGGHMLVYGYLSPQTQDVMQFYRELLRDLEKTLRELHSIADKKRHDLIRSKESMTTNEAIWVALFMYADDAYEKICYRWSEKTEGPDEKFSLLGENVRIVRKIEEKMDEVHAPEYREKLFNQIREFTKRMVLFTGRNVLQAQSAQIENVEQVEAVESVELMDILRLPDLGLKDLAVKVRNKDLQFVHHRQAQSADVGFTVMGYLREVCIQSLLVKCEEAPYSNHLTSEILEVFKGKKLPMNFDARDSEAFREYNGAIEAKEEKTAEDRLLYLCLKIRGFIANYLEYRYRIQKLGIPYHPNIRGMLHALAFHFKRNFDVFEIGERNQLKLVESFNCGVSVEESPPCYLLHFPSSDPRREYPHFDGLEDSRKATGLYSDLSKIGGFFNVDDNQLLDRAQKAYEASTALRGEAWENSLQVAIDCASKLVERQPKNPLYLMLHGKYLASTLDPAKRKLAINDFTTALEYCKEDQNNLRCKILIERGITYEYRGDIDQAIDDYSKILELEPDTTMIRLRRAMLFIQEKNDKNKGMSEFAYILERHKDNVDTLKARYRAAMFLEDYEMASLDALRMKQLHPQDEEIEQMVRQAMSSNSGNKRKK